MYYVYITGGNTGIGKATAYELARRNAKIIIACRNDIKGEAVARNIKIKTGNPFVSCSRLDLSNQRSIREFVQDFTIHVRKLPTFNGSMDHFPNNTQPHRWCNG
jgi:NAD(P)-dependent dehydrogenase (short-subunit alcohol dehydrogenase family)